METTASIPTSILRQGRIIMNEPAAGLRANLLELLQSVPSSMLQSGPVEKARAIFLLCWLHAVLTQRLRFAPLAFTKLYDFNDADFNAALGRLDAWINQAARSKTHLDPSDFPWAALKIAIAEYAFGGRIDIDRDREVLNSFVDHLFRSEAFDLDFAMTKTGFKGPDQTTWLDFLAWAAGLPEKEPPSLLGLPAFATKVLAVQDGN